MEEALKLYQSAFDIEEHDTPNSLMAATSYTNAGSVLSDQGVLGVASKESRKALETSERDAPSKSLTVDESCISISSVLRDHGDLEGALKESSKALEIQEVKAPSLWKKLFHSDGDIRSNAVLRSLGRPRKV